MQSTKAHKNRIVASFYALFKRDYCLDTRSLTGESLQMEQKAAANSLIARVDVELLLVIIENVAKSIHVVVPSVERTTIMWVDEDARRTKRHLVIIGLWGVMEFGSQRQSTVQKETKKLMIVEVMSVGSSLIPQLTKRFCFDSPMAYQWLAKISEIFIFHLARPLREWKLQPRGPKHDTQCDSVRTEKFHEDSRHNRRDVFTEADKSFTLEFVSFPTRNFNIVMKSLDEQFVFRMLWNLPAMKTFPQDFTSPHTSNNLTRNITFQGAMMSICWNCCSLTQHSMTTPDEKLKKELWSTPETESDNNEHNSQRCWCCQCLFRKK